MSEKLTPPVKVTGGMIAGIEDEINGVRIYKGVPYGTPPVGELRFKPAVAPKPWDGVRECTQFGKSPMQVPLSHAFDDLWTTEFIIKNKEISEDCLNLNLWVPKEADKCPVLVYLFGGGLCSGGSSCEIYDGTRFAQKGVIYLTFDHRVGTLSLMSSEELCRESENGCAGNLDLKDIMSVLKWVKDNIASFGGDPDNVTIWGQSSGAMEVHALTISPQAKGLFKRAFAMGYNNFTRFAREWYTKEKGYEVSRAVIEESGKTWEEYKDQESGEYVKGTVLQNLVIDGEVIERDFHEAVCNGDTGDINIVVGLVPGDMMLGNLFSKVRPQEKEQLVEPMKSFFKDDYDKACKIYDVENRSLREITYEMGVDNLMATQQYYISSRRSAGTKGKTYNYLFAQKMPGPHADMYGAFHSCEVPYFNDYLTPLRKDYWKEEDRILSAFCNDAMVSFAKTGEFTDPVFDCEGELEYTYIRGDVIEKRTFPKERYDLWVRGYERQDRDY